MPRPGLLIFSLTALLVIASASSSVRADSIKIALLDFEFTTRPSGNFNGSVPTVLAPGESISFMVPGTAFSGFTEEQIYNAIFASFQDVPATATTGGGDFGILGTTISEPSPILVLGTALLGLGGYARRKLRQRNRECHKETA